MGLHHYCNPNAIVESHYNLRTYIGSQTQTTQGWYTLRPQELEWCMIPSILQQEIEVQFSAILVQSQNPLASLKSRQNNWLKDNRNQKEDNNLYIRPHKLHYNPTNPIEIHNPTQILVQLVYETAGEYRTRQRGTGQPPYVSDHSGAVHHGITGSDT